MTDENSQDVSEVTLEEPPESAILGESFPETDEDDEEDVEFTIEATKPAEDETDEDNYTNE